MPTQVDLDARIEELLDREDWWRLPSYLEDELLEILQQLYVDGLNAEAGRLQSMRLGHDTPAFMALAWDLQDARVRELIDAHGAEMVRNVNNGTKYYLRQMIKETVEEGLGITESIERIQRDLFGLPGDEASKFPRERIMSIVNYETNKAMSGAADTLRRELGLSKKQWFVNNVNPCDICLDNQSKGVVDKEFQYDGVFGPILYPPAHPRTCRCVVMASEDEVRGVLGTGPIDWPMTQ